MKGLGRNKIVLLCDYGLDDAAATAWLLEHIDRFERLDIVSIAGNMPLSVSQNNAMRILYQMKPPTNKVRLVDTGTVPQSFDTLTDIHGEDGTGCVMPPAYEATAMIPFDEWLETLDDTYALVSLGPCTVTKIILEKVGPLPLLLMGGNLRQQPNCNGREFNHAMDIPAFAACTAYPHAIATLDSCHVPLCDFYAFAKEDDAWSSRFIRRSVALSRERNEAAAYVYDLITVNFLLYPERFTVRTAHDRDGNRLSVLHYRATQPVWQE